MSTNISELCGIVIDQFTEGLLVYDENDELLYVNKPAERLLEKVAPYSLNFSLSDISKILEVNFIENKENDLIDEVLINKLTIKVTKKNITAHDKNLTLIQLEDLSTKVKHFKDNVIHSSDFIWKMRTRLTPIQNAITLLDEYEESLDKETRATILSNSQFEIFQIERYLENFRDLALINACALKDRMDTERVSLLEIVEKASSTLNMYANNIHKKYTFVNKITENHKVYADKQRLERIVESLLLNSLLYSEDTVVISVEISKNENRVSLFIRDNGIGIARDKQSKIFTYNEQGNNLDRLNKEISTGTELYLARSILLHFNAYISFISEEGKGTVFQIEFKEY